MTLKRIEILSMQVERQMGDLGEHAVNAGAHGDGGFPGLDVKVAGAEAGWRPGRGS